jgi:hypothetical protein
VRRLTVLGLIVMGLAGVGGGGWLVYSELARPATHAEVAAAARAEIASRWERLAAGQIFPANIPPGGYSLANGFGLIDPAGALTEAGKLSSLRTAAPLGPGVVAPATRLASGSAPDVIQAVHHSVWKVAGYSAIILAGLIVLFRARRLRKRWRRRASLRTTQSHRIGRGAPAEPAPPVAGAGSAGGAGGQQET